LKKGILIKIELHKILFCICIFLLTFNLPAETFAGQCSSVADGDTITVLKNGSPVKVRFLGIDCPEGDQTYGEIAKLHLELLILNKTVIIKEKYKDKYGRTVAEVFLSDKDIGLEMIRVGLAWHFKKYSSDSGYSNVETIAQRNKIGLWSLPNPVPPWEYRSGGSQSISSNLLMTTQSASTQVVYVTTSGTKYHSSSCSSLRKSKSEINLVDAINSGYSPCKMCSPPTLNNTESSIQSAPEATKASPLIQQQSSGDGQCQATTKKGTRCKRKAKAGSNYCWQHG